MRLFDTLLNSPVVQTFGWVLLHSLWQGFILALLLKGALLVSKRFSANTRYVAACLTLLLMLLLPVSTALWRNSEAFSTPSGDLNGASQQINESLKNVVVAVNPIQFVSSENEFSYKAWMQRAERDFMPWIVLVWSFGVFISSLRLLGIWTYTQRLKVIEKHLILEQWKDTVQKLSRQLRVLKPVVLLESSLVKVPTVIGWLKPVILVPSCALTGLTPEQFELILAHELAHVRRHDYLVNLFQTMIETVLFYHPAVWWVSNRIRNERENACDDLAVSVNGNAVVYARALVEMERLRKSVPSLAMAADGGSLTSRIHRLIGAEMTHSKRFAGLWVVLFITVLMLTFGVTKQHSTVIKDRLNEVLALDLSSAVFSDLNQSATEKPQTVEERRTTKIVTEERTVTTTSVTEKTSAVESKLEKDTEIENEPETAEEAPVAENEPVSVPAELPPSPEVLSNGISAQVNETLESQTGNKNQQERRQDGSPDFIDEMASVGYTNLTIKELINLKAVGVTAEYVKGLRAAGFNNLSVKELINLRAVGVTPAYVEGIRGAGYKDLSIRGFTDFKALGITPELISKYRGVGYDNLSERSLMDLAAQGISIDYISKMNELGFGKLTTRDLAALRALGVTPEYVKAARSKLGNDLTLKQIIDLKASGILKLKDMDEE